MNQTSSSSSMTTSPTGSSRQQRYKTSLSLSFTNKKTNDDPTKVTTSSPKRNSSKRTQSKKNNTLILYDPKKDDPTLKLFELCSMGHSRTSQLYDSLASTTTISNTVIYDTIHDLLYHHHDGSLIHMYNIDGYTPTHVVCMNARLICELKFMKLLVETSYHYQHTIKDTTVTALNQRSKYDGMMALHLALCSSVNIHEGSLLVGDEQDDESTEFTALSSNKLAITIDVLEYMIEKYPDAVYKRDIKRYNLPIHNVCITCTVQIVSFEIVLYLIQQWPQCVREVNIDGNLPIHLAVQINHGPTLLSLLGNGNGSEKQQSLGSNNNKYMNLQLQSQIEIVQYLLDYWPECLHVRNKAGQTPYEVALLYTSNTTTDSNHGTVREQSSSSIMINPIVAYIEEFQKKGTATVEKVDPTESKLETAAMEETIEETGPDATAAAEESASALATTESLSAATTESSTAETAETSTFAAVATVAPAVTVAAAVATVAAVATNNQRDSKEEHEPQQEIRRPIVEPTSSRAAPPMECFQAFQKMNNSVLTRAPISKDENTVEEKDEQQHQQQQDSTNQTNPTNSITSPARTTRSVSPIMSSFTTGNQNINNVSTNLRKSLPPRLDDTTTTIKTTTTTKPDPLLLSSSLDSSPRRPERKKSGDGLLPSVGGVILIGDDNNNDTTENEEDNEKYDQFECPELSSQDKEAEVAEMEPPAAKLHSGSTSNNNHKNNVARTSSFSRRTKRALVTPWDTRHSNNNNNSASKTSPTACNSPRGRTNDHDDSNNSPTATNATSDSAIKSSLLLIRNKSGITADEIVLSPWKKNDQDTSNKKQPSLGEIHLVDALDGSSTTLLHQQESGINDDNRRATKSIAGGIPLLNSILDDGNNNNGPTQLTTAPLSKSNKTEPGVDDANDDWSTSTPSSVASYLSANDGLLDQLDKDTREFHDSIIVKNNLDLDDSTSSNNVGGNDTDDDDMGYGFVGASYIRQETMMTTSVVGNGAKNHDDKDETNQIVVVTRVPSDDKNKGNDKLIHHLMPTSLNAVTNAIRTTVVKPTARITAGLHQPRSKGHVTTDEKVKEANAAQIGEDEEDDDDIYLSSELSTPFSQQQKITDPNEQKVDDNGSRVSETTGSSSSKDTKKVSSLPSTMFHPTGRMINAAGTFLLSPMMSNQNSQTASEMSTTSTSDNVTTTSSTSNTTTKSNTMTTNSNTSVNSSPNLPAVSVGTFIPPLLRKNSNNNDQNNVRKGEKDTISENTTIRAITTKASAISTASTMTTDSSILSNIVTDLEDSNSNESLVDSSKEQQHRSPTRTNQQQQQQIPHHSNSLTKHSESWEEYTLDSMLDLVQAEADQYIQKGNTNSSSSFRNIQQQKPSRNQHRRRGSTGNVAALDEDAYSSSKSDNNNDYSTSSSPRKITSTRTKRMNYQHHRQHANPEGGGERAVSSTSDGVVRVQIKKKNLQSLGEECIDI